MPFIEPQKLAGKKRKRSSEKDFSIAGRRTEKAPTEKIHRLEQSVYISRKHYNNIAELLSIAKDTSYSEADKQAAIIALLRVFSRLLAEGSFHTPSDASDSERVISEWLSARLDAFTKLLVESLSSASSRERIVVLNYLMRLVRTQVESEGRMAWENGVIQKITDKLVFGGDAQTLEFQAFRSDYFQRYVDVRYHVLKRVASTATQQYGLAENLLVLLLDLGTPAESTAGSEGLFVPTASASGTVAVSAKEMRKVARDAWLAVLRMDLDQDQRNRILRNLVGQIVPWITKPERLMDFLTDSYNQGGEASLLALTGLFYMIQEKNLDYPSFFEKLYSLLDLGLLQSRHRSRFFRLLDTFMSSTHLPAALVASFIKRLSRLALHAPPGAIVFIVPWTYNLFKRHPTCTFMMHREARRHDERELPAEGEIEDPFDMRERDPLMTRAIESDVWELVTLQSHYHPNVATLSKIISEQFTKQSYSLEDFLDHSYDSLLGPELDTEPKKSAVVEYEIPRTILMETAEPFGQLLESIRIVNNRSVER